MRKKDTLFISTGINLNIDLKEGENKFKSKIIGFVHNDYIIINYPPSVYNNIEIKNKLSVGKKIIVRYLLENTIYGFDTKIIGDVSKPKKLLFLSYPDNIEQYDLRKAKRWECSYPAEIHIDNHFFSGIIVNISEDGCRCKIIINKDNKNSLLDIDSIVEVKFRFPYFSEETSVYGIIKNLNKDSKYLHIGINFKKKIFNIEKYILIQ